MFSKKSSTNALASSQFSDSSKEEGRSQCLSISNEVPYHNPRSNSSSSGVGSGSESGASINGESETSDYQRSTPSPRDDPFQENSIDSSSNKSKAPNPKDDLGFVEDLSNEDNIIDIPTNSTSKMIQPSHNHGYENANN